VRDVARVEVDGDALGLDDRLTRRLRNRRLLHEGEHLLEQLLGVERPCNAAQSELDLIDGDHLDRVAGHENRRHRRAALPGQAKEIEALDVGQEDIEEEERWRRNRERVAERAGRIRRGAHHEACVAQCSGGHCEDGAVIFADRDRCAGERRRGHLELPGWERSRVVNYRQMNHFASSSELDRTTSTWRSARIRAI
jgi:hypothetical protein